MKETVPRVSREGLAHARRRNSERYHPPRRQCGLDGGDAIAQRRAELGHGDLEDIPGAALIPSAKDSVAVPK